ncbi:MAG: hypothetical protein ACOZEN_05455 [Thermodesulfobacteriota bacterium]
MSIKLVPGQLELWQMAADMSRFDKTKTAEAFRDYVSQVAKTQMMGPDLVPKEVKVTPDVDRTGRLVSFTA